jgi:hypothetical protein
MSKIKLAVALSILATFAVPVAAQAAPAPDLTSKVILTEHGDDNEFDSEDGEDSEDSDYEDSEDGEDSFGGTVDDNDGDRDVPMPSIVIDPNGLGHPHGGPEDQYDITRVNPGDGPLGTVNPRGGAPIRVDKEQPNRKTPADIFAEGSIIGLGALGAGAIALGAVAGVRSFRLRKSEKADYFYES